METLTPIELQVLRLTAGEPENLEQIYGHLRDSPWKAPLADAADAVRSLVEKGVLAPRVDEASAPDDVSHLWRASFEPTPKGREALTEEGAEPTRPRSLFGVFKDRNIRLTREDLDEARREMWGKFDQDDPR